MDTTSCSPKLSNSMSSLLYSRGDDAVVKVIRVVEGKTSVEVDNVAVGVGLVRDTGSGGLKIT